MIYIGKIIFVFKIIYRLLELNILIARLHINFTIKSIKFNFLYKLLLSLIVIKIFYIKMWSKYILLIQFFLKN